MAWLKKGDDFLPNISITDLSILYKKEKNAKGKLRLLAGILRKKRKTLEEIAFTLQKPKTTVHDWLKRFEEGNVKHIYDMEQKGNKRKLTIEQRKELKSILEKSPEKQNIPFKMWTTKLIQYLIYYRYNLSYNQSGLWKLVKQLDFSFKIPRQENSKANKKLQEEFKKNLKCKCNIIINLDSRSFVLMKRTL